MTEIDLVEQATARAIDLYDILNYFRTGDPTTLTRLSSMSAGGWDGTVRWQVVRNGVRFELPERTTVTWAQIVDRIEANVTPGLLTHASRVHRAWHHEGNVPQLGSPRDAQALFAVPPPALGQLDLFGEAA